MHLMLRPARIEDLPACVSMIPDGFQCKPELLQQMPDIWKAWLSKGLLYICIVEDTLRAEGAKVVGFGSCVFLNYEFAAEMIANPRPYLATELARLWQHGECPMMDVESVRRANSGPGLNLHVLHIGWTRSVVAPDELAAIKVKIFESLLFYFLGYRLNILSQEYYSTTDLKRAEAIGMVCLSDYDEYFQAHPDRRPPDDYRTYLSAVRRGQVPEGCALAPLFVHHAPQIHFRMIEQELLHLALFDFTDAEIAAELCISTAAVHKRWQSVFDRAVSQMPGLFPGATGGTAAKATRGAEKRRHLLRYLRNHLEELRPYVA